MRKINLVLWMLALLGVFGTGAITSAQETAPVPPLQVVDTNPLPGEELALTTPIAISFDRPLNCDSLALAITISPAVEGSAASCSEDGMAVLFGSTTPFAPATTYTLTISDAASGADGSRLPAPLTFEWTTVGFLRVTEILPAPDTVDVAADALLTIIFNRPVVALGAVEEIAALPSPITLSPDVEGVGEWLNTSIYTFRPARAWAGGTRYTVTVSADLTALDGAAMESAYSAAFTTALPQLVEVNPLDETIGIPLEPMIQATFNQPLDQASLERAFYLRPQGSTESVAGTFEWNEAGTGFAFTPSAPLQLNTVYDIGYPDAAVFEVTGAAALPAADWQVATVRFPAITGTSPFDGQTDAPPFGGITLFFGSLMDVETLEDKITIEPAPWREPDFFYADYNNTLSVTFPTEPSTTYTVTIAPGMADVYGNTIDTPFTFSYTTVAYAPEFALQAPIGVGVYDAGAERTQVFVSQRNVSRLDLSLFLVDLGEFIRRTTDPNNYYSPSAGYVPDQANLLRSWQVPNVAPLNALRYDLLDIGAGTTVGVGSESGGEAPPAPGQSAAPGSVECPGAPASRLNVGDTAIVITDPDPLRARATPPDGEIVDLLYRGYPLPIVGGPVCANALVWWEVQLRDERRAWVAEGLPDEYFIDVQFEGSSTSVTVPGGSFDEGPLDPGIYYLEVNSPESAAFGYTPQQHFMVVATANLTLKVSVDSATVWATDLQTGMPIANASISLYNSEGTAIAQGTTGEDGLLTVSIPRVNDLYVPLMAVLLSAEDFGVALSNWSEGIDPWRFNQSDEFYPRQYRLYMYSDRPVYRPGQPVYFRGVVRLKDDMRYTRPELVTVPVRITNEMGETVYEQSVELSPFGTFSGQFDLAPDAGLGYYTIVVDLPTTGSVTYEGGSLNFGVAEYRLPEFQVNMTAASEEVVNGDTISVTLDSRFFFGGAVSGADVTYNVIATDYFFDYAASDGRYEFIDFDYDAGPSEFLANPFGGVIASGTGTTDAQGRLVIEVPADVEESTRSQTFLIEAAVTDESDQVVAGRVEVVVHKGLIYLGARPQEYVTQAGQETAFDLVAVDWDGAPVAEQAVDVQVVERVWSSVQEQDENGRTTWTYEVEEVPVTRGQVTTNADGQAVFRFTPPNGGIFKAIVTTLDEAGNEVRSASTIWVSSGEYVAWRQQNSNRMDLIADQESYAPGDVAQVLITSPFQGSSEALITVERGDVLLVERVTLESNSFVYELPITEDYAPNVYVSVVLVKGVDDANPVAAFRMGLIQLAVDPSRKELTIEITPNSETGAPGETVTYTVRTTDYAGNPVRAEVGVGLTDLASLSIAPPNSQAISAFFYGPQGLSVRTASPLTISTDQITQTVLDTIKGGGGGGGEGGIFDIREDFVDTAYWNAQLVTGSDGTATFQVTLPDNLTTWRLDARAVTVGEDGDLLVGQDTFDLLSTRPLLVRPVTPRFFVVNDAVVLGAIVNNNTEAEQTVEVTIEGTGVVFAGDVTQTVTVPAGGRQRVNWPVTVADAAAVDLTFFARSTDDQFSDASKPPLGQGDDRLLPVYRFEAPEVTGTGGVLREEGSRTEGVSLPRRFATTQGELTLSVDTSLVQPVLDGLEALRVYPNESIEATVSRFLPNLAAFRVLSENIEARTTMSIPLETNINLALQQLTAQQKLDGGWGWYVQDASNPLVSAYALIGLAEARDGGFAVDPAILSRAQAFLRTQFITPGDNQPDWRLDRQAFILYALAVSGDPDVARMSTLLEFRDRLSLYAKALLAVAESTVGGSTDVLVSDLVSDAILSANGVHWEEERRDAFNWNTDTRTTAIVLGALLQLTPDSELIPNAVRWLMTARSADAWRTTQETAWALLAFADWLAVSGELEGDYTFSATFNGESVLEGSAVGSPSAAAVVRVDEMLADAVNTFVIERGAGAGSLYYDAYLRVFLPVPEIAAENRGLVVERRYSLLDDPDARSISEASVGQLVRVHLTIIAPNDLHYVMIEDPIPAGAEAINPELTTSQQVGTQPVLVQGDPLSQGWGWWWFSNTQFRDEKVVLNATFLPAGTYEYVYTLRTGLAGTYNVLPVTGVEFYFPDVYGRSAGSTFTITPGE